jgi:hypothetical protein
MTTTPISPRDAARSVLRTTANAWSLKTPLRVPGALRMARRLGCSPAPKAIPHPERLGFAISY